MTTGATSGWGRTWRSLAHSLAPALVVVLLTAPSVTIGSEARHITFRDAVEIALQQNSSVHRAANDTLLDRATVSQAKMSFLPDLRLSMSGGKSYTLSPGEEDGAAQSEGGRTFRAGLSSSLVLFDGMANWAILREARILESAGIFQMERTRQTVVFTVISGFLAMIEADEQVRVREENAAAQEDLERQVQALFDGGERPISDLYQQQANVASARLSLVEARRIHDLSKVDLVQALQLDPASEYVFETPPLPESPAGEPPPELSELLEIAFRERPDVRAMVAGVEAAEQAERAAAAGRWPTVSLSAGYGANYSSRGDGGFADQLDDSQSGDVGVSLSLPLFDRFSTRRDVERARINVDNARISLTDIRQDVALQVRRAILDWNAARERLRAAEAQVRAGRQALTAIEERYQAGVATLYEVTLGRADFVGASSAEVNASYNMLWQDRLLDYYVGQLDPAGGLGR